MKVLIGIVISLMLFTLSLVSVSAQVVGRCGQSAVATTSIDCPLECPANNYTDSGTGQIMSYCGYITFSCGQTVTPGVAGRCVTGCSVSTLDNGQGCCGYAQGNTCLSTPPITVLQCGQLFSGTGEYICACPSNVNLTASDQSCCGYINSGGGCSATPNAPSRQNLVCGQTFSSAQAANYQCTCGSGITTNFSSTLSCCGWVTSGSGGQPTCSALPSGQQPNFPGSQPTDTLTEETLNYFDPLITYRGTQNFINEDLSTPGGIITRIMNFAFPIAGLILFVMLLWSGFEMVSGATNKKSVDAGKQRATAAVIGFVLLFVSYWIVQLIEVIFGVAIF